MRSIRIALYRMRTHRVLQERKIGLPEEKLDRFANMGHYSEQMSYYPFPRSRESIALAQLPDSDEAGFSGTEAFSISTGTGRMSVPTYIIAEIGVNHNGDVDLARRMIDAAVDAGANATKFQTFRADLLVNRAAEKAAYQRNATDAAQTQYEMLHELELSQEAHYQLASHCRNCGLDFVSTPFDAESARFLVDEIGMPWVKVPSGEIVNGPLLLVVSRLQRPLVVSTGMATEAEVAQALEVITHGLSGREGNPRLQGAPAAQTWEKVRESVTLLHCTSAYPTPYEDVNLRAMDRLRSVFGTHVGLSDHTEGIAVSVGAVARGARIIEKHFTIDRSLPGPDQAASLEPTEFSRMVKEIRIVEMALGEDTKAPSKSERENINLVRQGLVAARPIEEGEIFTPDCLVTQRPATGTSPMRFWALMGKLATRTYATGEPIVE